MAKGPLYRTRAIIWTDFDPAGCSLPYLAQEADDGGAFCSDQTTEQVTNPDDFPATEFFDDPDEEEA